MAARFDGALDRSCKSVVTIRRAAREAKAPALLRCNTTSTGTALRCIAASNGASASASPIASRRMISTDAETFGMPVHSDRHFRVACPPP